MSYHLTGRNSKAIVLLHGYASSGAVWRFQLKEFSKNYSVLAPDLRGWGNTDKPPEGHYNVSDFSHDIAALTNSLGFEEFVLAGSSMGGLIAQQYYLEHKSQVRGLVLVGTRAQAKQDLDEMASVVEKEGPQRIIEDTITKCFAEEGKRPELTRYLLDQTKGTTKDAALGCLLAFRSFDLRDRLNEYEVPTLIVFGERDRITGLEEAMFLHEHIKRSRLEIFPGVGHLPMLEAPEHFNSVLSEFLKQIIDSSARGPHNLSHGKGAKK